MARNRKKTKLEEDNVPQENYGGEGDRSEEDIYLSDGGPTEEIPEIQDEPGLSPAEQKSKLMLGVIAKLYPKNNPIVNLTPDSFQRSLPHFSSGSIMLDYTIGGKLNKFGVQPCPGLPRGKITQIYGHEGSGKTTLALEACKQIVLSGGSILYLDWENAIDPSYAKSLNIPVDQQYRFSLAQPDTLEEGLVLIWVAAIYGVDMVVIDSIGAGVPNVVFTQDIEKTGQSGRIGLAASLWSQFLPKLQRAITKKKTAVLGIAQVRKAINTNPHAHGETETVQGGEAWKFYSALRIRLNRFGNLFSKQYNRLTHSSEEVAVGFRVRAKIVKCKVSAAQQSETSFYLRFGTGIDDIQSVIDIAVDHGFIRKGGAWYTWQRPDGDIRGQGMDSFRANLLQSKCLPELLQGIKGFLVTSGETVPEPEPDPEGDAAKEAIRGVEELYQAEDDDSH